MNEAELRALVRAAVARHLGTGLPSQRPAEPARPLQMHSSHSLYAGLVNVTGDCVIEPAVTCDHCGYCKSHGH